MRTIEQVREAKRLFMARKRADNPEAARAYHRARHFKNHEANKLKMRAYYGRRFFWGRAMKLRGEGRANTKELASLWKRQRGICCLTGRRLDRTAQLDHIMPKARNGSDRLDNLRWVCPEVNILKRNLTDDELLSVCSDVMSWIGKRIKEFES